MAVPLNQNIFSNPVYETYRTSVELLLISFKIYEAVNSFLQNIRNYWTPMELFASSM